MITRAQTVRLRKPRSRRGIAAVECAIVAPLLILLVLGAVDVGQYANVYQKVSDASREAARAAVRIQTSTTSDVQSAAMSYLQQVFPKVPPARLASAVEVTVTDGAGKPLPSSDLNAVASGSQIGVTVTVHYDLIRWIRRLQFLNGRDLTISTTMRRE